MNPSKDKIVVIGAGIIGLCTAYYLTKQGFKVTILEQGDLYSNCSSGNAGMIVPSHFVPLAAPGMISKGVKWMFDSKSPFYVKPSLNLDLISWGLKFWRSANQGRVDRAAVPLRDLHLLSRQLYHDLAKEPMLDFGLADRGILMLYKTAAVGEEEIHLAKKAQDLGLDVAILNADQTQALEPQTALSILGSVHYRCDSHLNPHRLVKQLVGLLKLKDVEIKTNCKVQSFEINAGHIDAVIAGDQCFKASQFVMTGGAWLPSLAKTAGLNIPIMPGKGYSFLVDAHQAVPHPSLLLEARVAVTPMDDQIRFGGTMEIAPINEQINLRRVEGIINAIPKYYPNYKVEMPKIDKIWFGFRPCSPDGMPYIGYSKKLRNLIVAGGHGMMGISLAPATGKLVSELMNGEETSLDLSPYSPDRY